MVIQAEIDRLIKASLAAGDTDLQKSKLAQGLKELRKSVDDHGSTLVPQIVFYEFAAKNERLMYAAEYLLLELLNDLSSKDIITAIAPYLHSKDKSIRIRLLEVVDYHVCKGPPTIDYRRVFSLMERNKGELPDGLVQYMFERSPGEAMLGYMRYYRIDRFSPERRNLLLAEREISNTLWKHQFGLLEPHKAEPSAIAELEKLSRSKYWWARLYVAEIMRQHRGFRRPEIIERLKKDEHPLVRKAMQFADKDAPQ